MAVLGHITQYSYLAYQTLHNVSFEITRISLKGFLGLINERENRSTTSVLILFFNQSQGFYFQVQRLVECFGRMNLC